MNINVGQFVRFLSSEEIKEKMKYDGIKYGWNSVMFDLCGQKVKVIDIRNGEIKLQFAPYIPNGERYMPFSYSEDMFTPFFSNTFLTKKERGQGNEKT